VVITLVATHESGISRQVVVVVVLGVGGAVPCVFNGAYLTMGGCDISLVGCFLITHFDPEVFPVF
tara:strand:- start:301 stop:495 length:195 start_codon:yes stop_codon:yes gene_type:complete